MSAKQKKEQTVFISEDMPRGYVKIRHELWSCDDLKKMDLLCLLYMLGRPKDWHFSVNQIADQLGCGVSTVKNALVRLRMLGFCRMRQLRENGVFGVRILQVSDVPVWFDSDEAKELRVANNWVPSNVYKLQTTGSPLVENQLAVEPPADAPLAARKPHTKKEGRKKDSSEEAVAGAPASSSSRLRLSAPQARQAVGLNNNNNTNALRAAASGRVVGGVASPSAPGSASPTGKTGLLTEDRIDFSAYPETVERFVRSWNEVYKMVHKSRFLWMPEDLDRVEDLLYKEDGHSPETVVLMLMTAWVQRPVPKEEPGSSGYDRHWACCNYSRTISNLLHVPTGKGSKKQIMVDRIKDELDWHYRRTDIEIANETLERLQTCYVEWLEERQLLVGS